ncbi:MAG: VOC family protein [Candidatus Levybacteria bacterium]|nr:VOC family protein [Candidatus Levybacteria bacterium]
MNPVVHFEMPARDKKRTKKFYETVFGWEMTQLGKDMGSYLLATTTPLDKNRMHKKKGAINGGFFQWGPEGKIPHIVISVDNLKKHMETVKKSGGKIQGKPMDIPDIGQFVMFKDTEGNMVGMLQPTNM